MSRRACAVYVATAVLGALVLAGCPSDEREAEFFASTYGVKRPELVLIEEEVGTIVTAELADPRLTRKCRAVARRARKLSDWFSGLYPPRKILPAVNDLAFALGDVEFRLRFIAWDVRHEPEGRDAPVVVSGMQRVAHKLELISRLRRKIDAFAGVR